MRRLSICLFALWLCVPSFSEDLAVNQAGQPSEEQGTKPGEKLPSDGWQTGPVENSPDPIAAQEPLSRPTDPEAPSLLAFQAGAMLFLQSGGGNSFTGQVAWTPGFMIDRYELRGELGLSVPKNSLGDLFIALNYEILFRTKINPDFRLDLGGGMQTFTGSTGTTKPVASAQLTRLYHIKSPVNIVYLGYSAFFTARVIHTFKFGVGFRI